MREKAVSAISTISTMRTVQLRSMRAVQPSTVVTLCVWPLGKE